MSAERWLSGVVAWYDPEKGYGFLRAASGLDGDVFIGRAQVLASGHGEQQIQKDTPLEFTCRQTARGWQALSIRNVAAGALAQEPSIEVNALVKSVRIKTTIPIRNLPMSLVRKEPAAQPDITLKLRIGAGQGGDDGTLEISAHIKGRSFRRAMRSAESAGGEGVALIEGDLRGDLTIGEAAFSFIANSKESDQ